MNCSNWDRGVQKQVLANSMSHESKFLPVDGWNLLCYITLQKKLTLSIQCLFSKDLNPNPESQVLGFNQFLKGLFNAIILSIKFHHLNLGGCQHSHHSVACILHIQIGAPFKSQFSIFGQYMFSQWSLLTLMPPSQGKCYIWCYSLSPLATCQSAGRVKAIWQWRFLHLF